MMSIRLGDLDPKPPGATRQGGRVSGIQRPSVLQPVVIGNAGEIVFRDHL